MLPAANRLIFPATRWLTFDCYGTLIDWKSGIQGAFRRFLARKDRETDLDELFRKWERIQFGLLRPYRPYRDVMKESFAKVMRGLRLKPSSRDANDFVVSLKTWEPFPDVRPALERLKNRYLIALVTNMDDDLVKLTQKRLGVFFNVVVTAEQVQCYKPNPKHFKKLLEATTTPPEEMIHCAFGTKYDLFPAHRLGFKTALIERGPVPRTSVVPDYRFANLTEMADLFLAQFRA
ncbi:MAG: HAD-IA family hydrolase [Nitrospirae bacterium]|nr:HAD-IA family hydrolase [Nitrospirota bacterium]